MPWETNERSRCWSARFEGPTIEGSGRALVGAPGVPGSTDLVHEAHLGRGEESETLLVVQAT